MTLSESFSDRLSATGTANALELRGVSRSFGALVALDDVSITMRPGERRAVLGSNGAGKTTLFNCITGDFLPSAGSIRFYGEDITGFPPQERIRRGLRRTYQISLLFSGLTVLDNIYLACRGVLRGRFSMLRPPPKRTGHGKRRGVGPGGASRVRRRDAGGGTVLRPAAAVGVGDGPGRRTPSAAAG